MKGITDADSRFIHVLSDTLYDNPVNALSYSYCCHCILLYELQTHARACIVDEQKVTLPDKSCDGANAP